uniref:BofC_C domain-containing protein n=2 Tax=Macrostomum lignano TaxID=282301 RepID=A0A1I8HZR7_9PLAT
APAPVSQRAGADLLGAGAPHLHWPVPGRRSQCEPGSPASIKSGTRGSDAAFLAHPVEQFASSPGLLNRLKTPASLSNTQAQTDNMNGILSALLFATVCLVCLDSATARARMANPAAAELGAEGHSGHQIFRLKKGYHFFRLKKPSPSEQEVCAIDAATAQALGAVARAAHEGRLCDEDREMLRGFLGALLP